MIANAKLWFGFSFDPRDAAECCPFLPGTSIFAMPKTVNIN
jgi:hypothetical protein